MRFRTPRSWAVLAATLFALALAVVSGGYTASATSVRVAPKVGTGLWSTQTPIPSPSPTGDTVPPSKPTGLRDRCSSDYVGVVFCWDASTDNVAVVGYDVYREGAAGYVKIGTALGPGFGDNDVVIGTSYTYIVVARDAAGNVSEPSDPLRALARDTRPNPSPSPTVTPPPALQCHVTYKYTEWRNGQNAAVTVKNTGTNPISGWTLAIKPGPRALGLISGYGARWSQTGTWLNAQNLSWNRVIPPGGSVRMGFTATFIGTTPLPEYYLLNGVSCSSDTGPRQ
ncbi:hypothetical protein Sme01_00690 [Sphaerisporangium melleum]|uniref:CBM2 domain-containing protein n=1 Tax=Sphaerisporangium melleum TaxID=321316 RepID=A0A917RJT8_9ACTN|nr:cellulose binding domain-containing protein [Sphaerisporangium melleum]GGL09673.1 hypothetical protein GCM10007964_59910 [Sphaerisporangium melleum]GII67593.1 hypothetical protein Sme01_00690 [Sphaerisporangium melleum]